MPTLVIRVEDAVGNDDYPVQVYLDDGSAGSPDRPCGEGQLPRQLPAPDFPLAPGRSVSESIREAVLSAHPPNPARLAQLGSYLYELLAGSGIGPIWNQLHPTDAPVEGLLTVFDVRPAELRQLPWELLNRDGRRSFTDQANPHVRGRFPFRTDGWNDLAPVRMLVVVGSNDPKLHAEGELAAIHAAIADSCGQVHSEVLVGPERGELFDAVALIRPHVFHFIGHGRYSPGTTVPVLELQPPDAAEPWELTGDDVRNGFGGWVPRLVVLNACRTTQTEVQAGVFSVAEAFRLRGTAAVVCMQGDVDSQVAVRFAGAFYAALGNGLPVDRAMVHGRTAIWESDEVAGLGRRDWALPMLSLAVAPDRVLPMRSGLAEADLHGLRAVPEFAELRRFVDRGTERRSLWWNVDPVGEVPARDLVAVTGVRAAGRTRLVYSCLLTCAVRGRQVRYVDLGGAQCMSWLDVLYTIRDGSGSSSLQSALPAAAFATFNQEITDLAAGREPPGAGPVGAAVAGPAASGPRPRAPRPAFEVASEHAREYAERIFARFREALLRAADGQPLILAIDHLRGVNRQGGMLAEHLTGYLCPMLLRAVAAGKLPGVRVILVLRDEERDLLTPDVREVMHEIAVPGFPRRSYLLLLREYYTRVGHEPRDWHRWERVLAAHEPILPPTWYPVEFTSFDETVRRWTRQA